jgi:4-hydroxy-4-methyl-2-oxoglutarate aldolase
MKQGGSLLRRLASLDASAVSDALDAARVSGVALGLTALSTQRRIVGRAITVKLGASENRTTHRHLCTEAVEASGPGTIILVEHGGRADVAGWGGILSLAASQRGAEGVVIDGACRDIDESRELHFPVYARCAVPVTARGRIIEIEWNRPIALAGVPSRPGDFVIADGSGVVIIPEEIAAAVIEKAELIVAREKLMSAAVRGGSRVSSVMGQSYEEMLKRLT